MTKNFVYFGDRQNNMRLKIKCYWEVLWKHIGKLGNVLGTPWELDGNRNKTKQIPPPPIQNYSSPFSTSTNTPIISWGYLLGSNILGLWVGALGTVFFCFIVANFRNVCVRTNQKLN
jgi:hypothetical protein